MEARQLSPVELLSLRSGPFSTPVKTFQWLPTTYKVKSRYFSGCGSLAGQDSNHNASLVTARSLATISPCPQYMPTFGILGIHLFILSNSPQTQSPTTSHEACTEAFLHSTLYISLLPSQVSLPSGWQTLRGQEPWLAHLQHPAQGLPHSECSVNVC